jgi:hypothetical protein
VVKRSPAGNESGLPGRATEHSGSVVEALPAAGVAAVHTGIIQALLFALWIAICSVAPEFIWQGLLQIVQHFSWSTVASALLVGAIVAFFVEPLTERLRVLRLHVEHKYKTPAHATVSAFTLAVLAVFAHDAIVAFTSGGGVGEHAGNGLVYAISEVVQWAWIPLVVTLAWVYARQSRWIRWAVLLMALVSIGLVGPVFDWDAIDIVTTVIPCVCVLFGGYYLMRRHPEDIAFARCTKLTAAIAIAWLVLTGALQALLSLFAVKTLRIYTWIEYPIDFRFYVGWVIGLVVAPRPTAFIPGRFRRSRR